MKSRIAGLALAGLAVVGLAAPAAAQSVLRLVPNSDLKLLDPVFTPEGITVQHGLMIYDTLFAWDEALAPKPQMVGGHTVSADKLTYVFTLRDGLAFHDGQKLTSKDVGRSRAEPREHHEGCESVSRGGNARGVGASRRAVPRGSCRIRARFRMSSSGGNRGENSCPWEMQGSRQLGPLLLHSMPSKGRRALPLLRVF